MSNIPQMNGMEQVVMSTPKQDVLNAAAEVKMQAFVAPNNIVEVPAIGIVIDADRAMADNDIIRLSKNKKMRMAHRGFKAINQTWETAPTYSNVAGTWKYVAPDARPSLVIASTDDGIVYTELGSFTETSGYKDQDYNGSDLIPYTDYQYGNNASSSSANDGLVGPDLTALGADQLLRGETIVDNPGMTGGPSMTQENYLTFPGYPVVTSMTVQDALDKIDAMRVLGDASELTTTDLLNCGISSNSIKTAKLAGYKSGVVAATETITAAVLAQIIFTANA
jgi:hypothetical protein